MNGLGNRSGPRVERLDRNPGGKPPASLDGIRVIDLATPRAELAGRVLADLGAEVLKLEPPEGAGARRLPPFETGREGDPEASRVLCRGQFLLRRRVQDRRRLGSPSFPPLRTCRM